MAEYILPRLTTVSRYMHGMVKYIVDKVKVEFHIVLQNGTIVSTTEIWSDSFKHYRLHYCCGSWYHIMANGASGIEN